MKYSHNHKMSMKLKVPTIGPHTLGVVPQLVANVVTKAK